MSQFPSDVQPPESTAPSTAPNAGPGYPMPARMRPAADYWGLVLGYGVVTLAAGIILAVWPGETLKVVAVLVGIQFLVSGIVRIFSAVTASHVDGGLRALTGISGALAIIVGLLCLRDPLQTLVAVGILLGAWWVVSGVIDVLGAFIAPTPGRVVWDVLGGVVSFVAGAFLLVYPDLSLGICVLVACLWLFATGLTTVLSAFALRATRGHGAAAPDTPAAAV